MIADGRALTEQATVEIYKNVCSGCYHDRELDQLFQTIAVQRRVLRQLFDQYKWEPLRRVSNADPIHNSTLAHLKELVSMEDAQP